MTRPTRAADILARRLYEAGCRHAFGMPGGEGLAAPVEAAAVGLADRAASAAR